MYAAFILAFAVESQLIMFPQIYLLFGQTFGEGVVWLVLILTFMASTAFELGLQIDYKMEKTNEHAVYKAEKFTYNEEIGKLAQKRKEQRLKEHNLPAHALDHKITDHS